MEHVKPAHWRGILFIIIMASCMMPAAASVYFTSSTPQVITKGDTFSVSGTGAMNGTVALWIIGRNYFEIRSTAPDRHGNFSFVLKPTETEKLTGGQFIVIVQDPGPDGAMEIEPGKDSTGNLTIMNRGKIIAWLGAREDISGKLPTIADTLSFATGIQGVDDSFLTNSFFVEEPATYFDQIIPGTDTLPGQISGETIVITGTTNVGTENTLRAELHNRDTDEMVTEKAIPIVAGDEVNHWTCTFDSPGLQPGNYDLSIGGMKSNTSDMRSAEFPVVRAPGPSEPSGPPMTMPSAAPQLPQGLDTLLIIGIIFVLMLILYTVLKR
jgi:hypothetical protein